MHRQRIGLPYSHCRSTSHLISGPLPEHEPLVYWKASCRLKSPKKRKRIPETVISQKTKSVVEVPQCRSRHASELAQAIKEAYRTEMHIFASPQALVAAAPKFHPMKPPPHLPQPPDASMRSQQKKRLIPQESSFSPDHPFHRDRVAERDPPAFEQRDSRKRPRQDDDPEVSSDREVSSERRRAGRKIMFPANLASFLENNKDSPNIRRSKCGHFLLVINKEAAAIELGRSGVIASELWEAVRRQLHNYGYELVGKGDRFRAHGEEHLDEGALIWRRRDGARIAGD